MSTSTEFAQFETAFVKARGVTAVRVSRDKTGALKLSVGSTGERNPKQIVRDLKAIAQLQFKTELDHKFISVVEPRGEGDVDDDALKRFRRNKRVLIEGVELDDSGAMVTLRKGKNSATTKHAVENGKTGDEIVALCTIEALCELEPSFSRMSIGSAQTIDSGKDRAAVVTVNISGDDGEHVAAGCAVIRDAGEPFAIARAVLDAVNRRIAQG